MSEPIVYLAGPMSGLTFAQANEWREFVTDFFDWEMEFLNPMRGKENVFGDGTVEGHKDYGHLDLMSSIQTIIARDTLDVRRCDVVLANFTGSKDVSIGTIFELGYAAALNKPVVAIVPKGNVHDHIFVTHPSAVVVETLEQGIDSLASLLHIEIDRVS